MGSPTEQGLFPKPQEELVSSHRCDEKCLSCEGSSRNCSRCKAGFAQLGTSCITNHTCSNGECPSAALRAARAANRRQRAGVTGQSRGVRSDLFDHPVGCMA